MYINKIKIENFGPINNLIIDSSFDEDRNPLPLILVGTNGSGKTSILANIIDSLVELKKKKYNKLQEVEGDNYFKVGKKNYITTGKEYNYVNIQFIYNNQTAHYIDFSRNISNEEFSEKFNQNDFENIQWGDAKLIKDGYFKNTIANDEFLESFEKEVLLYFPFSRYETPAWWNSEHDLGFNIQEKYLGASDRNFIKSNIVKEVEEWLLNVFLDAEIYEKQLIEFNTALGNNIVLPEDKNYLNTSDILLGYAGKNTSLKNSINALLTILYKAKDSSIERVRLGISDKRYRRIAVIAKKIGLDEVEIAPTISHLSSGELMIFSLFCSILIEYDQLNINSSINLAEIIGTVIIDEIDLHLHIDLQKKLLPAIIKSFPKIQFIVTTHSPLFLMGIEESFEDIKAINLPQGNLIPLSEFSEVEESFNLFVEKFSSFKTSYQYTMQEISNLTKTLVITEGKTDWKHLKKALERFKLQGNFEDLDFNFLEYEDEINMGETELMSLCEQFSKTLQPRKIICIFDRDNPKIIAKITDPYVDFENNVYALCIPKPQHRESYNNISIEFLYTDEEIKTIDDNGKRLLFSNEVEKIVTQKMSQKTSDVKFLKLDVPDIDDELNKKIYDQDIDKVVDSGGNLVGLSKSVFAQNIFENKEGFSNFSIEPFKETFEIIESIINA